MKIKTYTTKGTKVEDTLLPKEFSIKVNMPLLAQAVYVYEDRAHIGLRKTKTRAEVNRSTKKIYKQKGTGGARHGSRRANLFVGGGIALGPRPVKRVLSLVNDVKNKAKFMAFSLKASDNQLVFVTGIPSLNKTKLTGNLVKTLEKETKAKKFTFILSEKSKEAARYLKNLRNVVNIFYKDVNALDIYKGGMIIMDKDIFVGDKAKVSGDKKETVKK